MHPISELRSVAAVGSDAGGWIQQHRMDFAMEMHPY
jgi:hypothetical protein